MREASSDRYGREALGHRDRSRIIDNTHLGLPVAGQRAVLVDVRVAATWTVRQHRFRIAPLRTAHSSSEQRAVGEEAAALAFFLDQGIQDVEIAYADGQAQAARPESQLT